MSGAIPPLPHYVFMAWCLANHRDNFAYDTDFRSYWYCNLGTSNFRQKDRQTDVTKL